METTKILRSLICLLLCLAMLTQPLTMAVRAEGTQNNLLKNGTFADNNGDGKADDWNYWKGNVAEAVSESDENGLTITADSSSEAQRLTVHQTVKNLDADKTYRFTGAYNVTSTSKGSLEIGYIPNATGSRTNAVKVTSKTDGVQGFDVTFTGCTSVKLEAAVSSGATLTCTISDFALEEVVAQEPETYTVSFDANGGSGGMEDVTEVSGEFTLPECGFTAPEGQRFKAWLIDGTEYSAGKSYTVDADTIAVAVWESVGYTVSFEANGGSGSMEDVTEVSGEFPLPECGFAAPEGQRFKAWLIGGTEYSAGKSYNVDADTTAVAVWESAGYTVSFAGNGGSGNMADVNDVSGVYTLPACGFTAPEGQQFKSWKIGDTEYAVGDSYTVETDTTVTAVWETASVEEPEYEDTLLLNGTFLDGSDEDNKADEWEYWNGTAKAAASKLDDNGLTITADSSSETQRLTVHQTVEDLDASKTYKLTGYYKVDPITKGALEIGYKVNAGGSLVSAVKVQNEVEEWTLVEQLITGCNSVKIEIAVSSGATLTCSVNHFKLEEVEVQVPETYTVSFEANGGSGRMEAVTEISGEFTLPECGFTAPEGQQFKSWKIGDTEYTVGASYYVETDTTVTAVWEAVPVVEPDYEDTLLLNGTFLDGSDEGTLADNWTYWNGTAAAAPATLDENGLTIKADSSSETQRLTVHQTVEGLDSSKTYKLTGYYKVDPISKGALEIGHKVNAGGNLVSAVKVQNKVEEWTLVEQLITGCNSVKIEIAVSSGATLTCSVNHFKLEEVEVQEPETYTVSFDANGGSGSMEAVTEVSGEFTLPECGFTAPEGQQFKSWKIGDTEYAVGASYNVETDTTVTAVWEAVSAEEPDYEDTLLLNGTFLDGSDEDTLADNWTYWNGTATAAPVTLDENGLTITADSTSEPQRLTVHQTVKNLDAAKTYRFTGAYNVTSTGKGSLEIGYTPNATGSRTNAVKVTSKTNGEQFFDVTFTGCESVKLEAAVSSGATLTATINHFKLVETEPAPVDDGNMVMNPTYATTDISAIPNWNYYPAYANNVGVNYSSAVSEGVFTGTVLGGSQMVLHQTIKMTQDTLNKTYKFTADVSTNNLAAGTQFKIYLQDASNKQLSSFLSPMVNGTTDWTAQTLEFEVPAKVAGVDVASIKIEHYINKGTGSASFRNPRLEITGEFTPLEEGDPMDSLVKNGGYETTLAGFPASWNKWISTGGLNAVSDRTVVKDGFSSLHLSNVTEGSDSRGSVHQTFNVNTPELQELWGQSVKVSQWVKTENYAGDALALRVHYATVSGAYISKSLDVQSTQDWTFYEYIIDLPDTNFSTIKVENLYDYAQGDVWIDNTVVTKYIKAKGIELNADKVVLKAGENTDLTVQFLPENTTIKEVTWVSDNEEVATVENGKVTAVADGVATLTVTHVDGMRKQIAVLVTDAEMDFQESISITTSQNTVKTGTLPEGYAYQPAAEPQFGTFLVEDGVYTYYPAKDFKGSDSVTLLVSKDGSRCLTVVPLTVTEVNGAPEFGKMTIITKVGEAVTGEFSATDPENDPLTYSVATAPENGTVTVSGSSYTFTPAEDFQGYDEVVFQVSDDKGNSAEKTVTIYVTPDTTALLNTVKPAHSRLLADDARFEELKGLISTDANAKAWFAQIKRDVDPLLNDDSPVPYQCPDGVRLDTQGSKDVLNLAFMYRMTGESAYLERSKLELLNLCGLTEETYPDWHPSHLLDTAMTANGVAIAYDWLYDYLTAEEKAQVEKAIYQNALVEARNQFEKNHMFVTNTENWNYICNGGFITAALALAHHENAEYDALAGEIMQRCYASIQYGLPQYAPEGASIEGISYWDYGTRYLVSLLASISSATTNNPFLDTPGLNVTAEYPIYMSGKAGSYNYSDNDMVDAYGYLNMWFAHTYGDYSWNWYHKYYMEKGNPATVYDLLYYYPGEYGGDAPANLDKFYTNQAVTTMRHDFTNPSSSFLGFKGGLNGAPHGDVDIGSFIYDIYGYRWAEDFGKDDYNLTGYWEIAPGGTRWNYYRKNAMGHNTLVLNPERGANQTVGAYAGKTEQVLNQAAGGYTILDMTDAYQTNAVSVKRGFAYFDRTQVLIRDEFTMKAPGTAYWQMHTKAAVTVSEDGKTATLTQGGKSLLLKLVGENASDGLKLAAMDATTYDGIAYEGYKSNAEYTKVYLKAAGVQKGVINVLITPVGMETPDVKSLNNWSSYDFTALLNCNHEITKIVPNEDGQTHSEICESCDEVLNTRDHMDADKDHNCDSGCGASIGTHADTNKDHNCDYGCKVVIGVCSDANKDHNCDYGCGKVHGEHSDSDSDEDSKCDYCGEAMPKKGIKVEFAADKTGTLKPGYPAEIDGKPIVIDGDGEIWLENKSSKLLVTYKFHEDKDPHKEYPTAMYVWYLKWNGNTCQAIRIPELDNFMTYQGTSIRVGHSSDGIRFFTSVSGNALNKAIKGTLLKGEMADYKLVEMGTLYKWAATGTELTTAKGVKSYVYGGVVGSTFRVFSKEGDVNWFTGMLTNLPGDAKTLAKDIISRPYAIFQDAQGKRITVYGGSVQRSVYYVALQNKNTWENGTAYDNYVEKIISTVKAAKG